MGDGDLSTRKVRALFLVGLLLGAVAGGGFAAVFSNTVPESGKVARSPTDGPTVTLKSQSVNTSGSGVEDEHTVALQTTKGNVTFVSHGDTNATINATNITGTWTNVTKLDVTSNELKINPEDKPAVNVSGGTDNLSFTDPVVDDGTADFVYDGTSGTLDITLRGLPSNTEIQAIDQDTNTLLANNRSDGSGTVVLTGLPHSSHTVVLQAGTGSPSLTDPSPQGDFSTQPSEFNVSVSDADFPNDNVTVEFFLNGQKQGQDSTTTQGEVSLSLGSVPPGRHTVKASATDQFGQVQNLTWTFSVPGELTIRNHTDPWAISDDEQIEATFISGNQTIETRTTSNGVFDLSGLPAGQRIVVRLDSDTRFESRYVIDDISQNETAFMLSKTTADVNVTFVLTDRTGGTFRDNNASLQIQKIINVTGTPQYNTTHSNEFGVVGYTETLEKGVEYRLIVTNDIGDTRVVGTYLADTDDDIVEVEIGRVEAVPADAQTDYFYNATYTNNSSGNNFVGFEYNDSANLTSEVSVTIYEFRNPSNVLFSNTTFGGPLGTLAVSEIVPSAQEENNWVVEATVVRDGEQFTIREVVGPRVPVLVNMPNWLVVIIVIGSFWIVAGLFSRLNGAIGGLAVAGLAGMYWFVGFLPAGLDTGVIVLAMILAGILYLNSKRDQGVAP